MEKTIQYDYIIAGGGCAGLSLATRMASNPFFDDKKILLLDQSDKDKDDRTWCFWENGKGFFEEIVCQQWQEMNFFSSGFSKKLNLAPYKYKMVRGLDFYQYCRKTIAAKTNFEIQKISVQHIGTDEFASFVDTNEGRIYGKKIFNSILFPSPPQANTYNMLQHFKGWYIKTKTPFFESTTATLMDFRIEQKEEVRFFYVLPSSKYEALIEFTIFSPTLLETEAIYDTEVKNYIQQYLQLDEYEIVHQEFGIIPMTNAKFDTQIGDAIFNIGVASGAVRPSTGYTFTNIQRQSDLIIEQITSGKKISLEKNWWQKRHLIYDSVILNVMQYNKYPGGKIFARLFRWNSAKQILKFLDGTTNFLEEYRIMNTTPIATFLPIFIKELRQK